MEKCRRKNYFIDKPFQTRFITRFCLIVIVSSVVITFGLLHLSRNFTTVAIENAHVIVKSTSDFMLPIILETVALVTFFSAISVILLTLFTSHKIAGPLYRLKKDVEMFKSGDLRVGFKTRSTDQVKDLAAALEDMGNVLGARHQELKSKLAELKNCLQNPGADNSSAIKKIAELESVLNYFKI